MKRSILRKNSFRIGLLVAVLCIMLFSIFNLIMIKGSEEAFREVVEQIAEEIPKQPAWPGKGFNIFKYTLAGAERLRPLHEEFSQVFTKSLLTLTAISIPLSFFIGYIASMTFSRPLQKLIQGMKNLRENNYEHKLKDTGVEEFDKVVSEFNKLSNELSRVEELRKNLISDTSHELKTPVTALKVQLEGVRDGVIKMNKKKAEELIKHTDQLSELVDTLQEYTKIRSRKGNLNKRKAKLKDIFINIKKEYKEDLKKQKLEMNIDIEDEIKIEVDKTLLKRALENIIQNSIKYSKGKNINIKYQNNKIIITDDGVGVPKKYLSDIFERFFRVDQSRNRKTGGMGLGLAIVKEIIESHDWNIKASNIKPKGLKIEIDTKLQSSQADL